MNLREIIIKVQSVLIPRSSYLRRVCNRAWCTHLRSDSRQTLLKKFKFLINHTTLRNIIKCFNRGLFSGDRDILHIIYNEIVRRGLHNTAYVKNIVSRYDERRSKYNKFAEVGCNSLILRIKRGGKRVIDIIDITFY